MKFSKLIKNGSKKQEMKLKRNAILLSGIYSTQSPTVVNNYFTPSKPTTTTFFDDIEKTIVPQTPQTYEQRYNINTIASTKKTPTFKISPLAKLFEFKSSNKNAVENAIAKQRLIQCLLETPGGCKVGTITPRFAKSEKSKTKRLQRRDLGALSCRKYELRSSCSNGVDQVDNNQTPKLSLFKKQVRNMIFIKYCRIKQSCERIKINNAQTYTNTCSIVFSCLFLSNVVKFE